MANDDEEEVLDDEEEILDDDDEDLEDDADDGDDEEGDDDSDDSDDDDDDDAEETSEEQIARLGKEALRLRRQLKKANRQAKKSRLKAKDAPDQEKANAKLQARLHVHDVGSNLEDALESLDIAFVSRKAQKDAVALLAADLDVEYDSEDLEELLEDLIEERPYLISSAEPAKKRKKKPNTHSKKRGKKGDALDIDEKEVANIFNL